MAGKEEISIPASRFYDHLLKIGRFVALTNQEIAEIMQVSEYEIGEYIRELDNRNMLRIWKRGKYGLPEFKAVPSNATTTSDDIGADVQDSEAERPPTLGVIDMSSQNSKSNNITQKTNSMIHSSVKVVPEGNSPTPSDNTDTSPSTPDGLLPRVHFIEITAETRDVFTHQDLQFQHHSASVEIQFGERRRKITCSIMQDKPGLSASEFTDVLNRVMDLVGQKLGRPVIYNEFKVVNMHINYDYIGLRLEGIKAITLFETHHWLSRLYAKQESIRSEGVLTGGEITLDQSYQLLMRSHEDRGLIRSTFDLVSPINLKLSIMEERLGRIDAHLGRSYFNRLRSFLRL